MGSIDTLVEYILFCHKQPFFLSFILCGITINWKKLDLSCLIQVGMNTLICLESRSMKWMEMQRNFHYFIYLIGAKLEFASLYKNGFDLWSIDLM